MSEYVRRVYVCKSVCVCVSMRMCEWKAQDDAGAGSGRGGGGRGGRTAVGNVAGPLAVGSTGSNRSPEQLVAFVTGIRRQGSMAYVVLLLLLLLTCADADAGGRG